MNAHQHIVIIEDDIMLADLTQSFLQQHNYLVTVYNTANAFLSQADYNKIDIIVCDINMPEMNGFELCKRVRDNYSGPFIFLTARKDDVDQIQGLELGADDYINKPVKPPLLLARIRASIKTKERLINKTPSKCIELTNLIIDKDARLLEVNNQPVTLTSDDLDLLWFLIFNKDKTLSRDDLFMEMMGRTYDGQDRVIDSRISRLRKKFNNLKDNPYEIKTVWRLGYVFSARTINNE
ncbi:response regulator transcription factor [Colwellia sp. 12G3]|uniref:response regulator transcription factor n=1 Tax=Colwellia sp. 12G3 TaxID=2058299 RepID=UPI000C33A7C7|nr:response regulator transcription factor [Colwellia sp. 12G3]PKI13234.1 DNA-binding response regulator [Colwellia sp. 12G3]